MDRDVKLGGGEIRVKSNFLLRVENFWYHYKWGTVIGAFFLIVFLICTLQMCGKEKEDISILYAGEKFLSVEELGALETLMETVMPEDFDGSGKKDAVMIGYQILSREQIEKIEAQTGEDGKPGYVDKSYNSSNYDNYYDYIQTGESSICLLSGWLYEELAARDRLMKLSDVLGEIPEGAISEYGIALGETSLYESYGVMQKLPEDTVICILRPLVVGKSSKEKMYAREKEMFSAMLEYNSDEK